MTEVEASTVLARQTDQGLDAGAGVSAGKKVFGNQDGAVDDGMVFELDACQGGKGIRAQDAI